MTRFSAWRRLAAAAAAGGAYLGMRAAQRSQTTVWRIDVRCDDGTLATVSQSSTPNLRVGDRVRVASTGIQPL